MRKYCIFLALFMGTLCQGYAAEPVPKPCEEAVYQKLDFWVGSWTLTWQGGEGSNNISKTYGGCVIQEDFKSKSFQGMSISMYDKVRGQWRQTWMDDQGSYFDFYGIIEGDDFIFQTIADPNNAQSKQRMIFTDIKDNSLTWLWQKSTDGGKSWEEQWKIYYVRNK